MRLSALSVCLSALCNGERQCSACIDHYWANSAEWGIIWPIMSSTAQSAVLLQLQLYPTISMARASSSHCHYAARATLVLVLLLLTSAQRSETNNCELVTLSVVLPDSFHALEY